MRVRAQVAARSHWLRRRPSPYRWSRSPRDNPRLALSADYGLAGVTFSARRARDRSRMGRSRMRMSAHHQHREHGDVTELVGDTAAQDIGEPAMSVRRHRDEVAPLALSAGCDFLGGITTGQNCLSLVAVLLRPLAN